MRVTLVKAIRLPGRPLRAAGSVVEVDEETAADLVRRGVVAEAATAGVVEGDDDDDDVEEDTVESVELPAAAGDDVDADPVEADGDTDPVDPVDENGRPRKTASVAAWRKFADAQGLPTKGLNKQQIIAALA